MKRYVSIFFLISIVLLTSCANLGGKTEGVFTIYPRDTFIKNSTGETGLAIEGEDWYSLIDLTGFEDMDVKFTSPDEFLMESDKDGYIASVFASKIPGVVDSETCLKCFLGRLAQMQKTLGSKFEVKMGVREIDGKKIVVQDTSYFHRGKTSRSINYYPYKNGYCFDYHLTVPTTEEGLARGIDIVKSIKFEEGICQDSKTRRYFYIWLKRLRLSYPSDWKCSLQKASMFPRKLSTIIFQPPSGYDFALMVSPVNGFRMSKVTDEDVKKDALEAAEKWNNRVSVKPDIREQTTETTKIYYYDAEDQYYNQEDPHDFPYVRQGFAYIHGAELYFTLFYRDKSSSIPVDGLSVIGDARLIDLF